MHRKGEFPGMLKARVFQVVIVGKSHGTGVDVTGKPDKVISYNGARQSVQFPH